MVAVLFDLEDTLTGSGYRYDIAEVRSRVRERLVQLGVPPYELEGLKLTLMLNKAYDYVSREATPREFKVFRDKVDELLEQYWLRSARESYLKPGAVEALEAIKAAGYRLGLVSNASGLDVSIVLEKHGLSRLFDTVVSRDDMRRLKPDPDGILTALRELREADFVLVGDSIHDLEAARRAGGQAIIVHGSPWQPNAELVKGAGAHLARSLLEVPRIVKQLFPPKTGGKV